MWNRPKINSLGSFYNLTRWIFSLTSQAPFSKVAVEALQTATVQRRGWTNGVILKLRRRPFISLDVGANGCDGIGVSC